MRLALTRLLGIRKWLISDEEVGHTAEKLRDCFARLM
jgi:hypothetical protein